MLDYDQSSIVNGKWEKAHASYEKQSNEIQRHIKFNINDLVQLNIWNFLNA